MFKIGISVILRLLPARKKINLL